jgi:hypothetical protein
LVRIEAAQGQLHLLDVVAQEFDATQERCEVRHDGLQRQVGTAPD